jgi:hypothetical protein
MKNRWKTGGTRIDEEVSGRAESHGGVNSGRRWHRRSPSQVKADFARPFVSVKGYGMHKRLLPFVTAAVLALVLPGCALGVRNAQVADLKYNPGRYYDKTVAIDGIVTSSWGVPLMPFKLYKVDDGTGEVTVLAQDGRTPTRGAHVRVKGKVSEVATFGGQSVGLHLRQTDIDFKRR